MFLKRWFHLLKGYEDPQGFKPFDVLLSTVSDRFVRLCLLICVVLFVSAIAVVVIKNSNRTVAIEHNQLLEQAQNIHTQWSQLLIEYQTWTNAARISNDAKQLLNMDMPGGMNSYIITVS